MLEVPSSPLSPPPTVEPSEDSQSIASDGPAMPDNHALPALTQEPVSQADQSVAARTRSATQSSAAGPQVGNEEEEKTAEGGSVVAKDEDTDSEGSQAYSAVGASRHPVHWYLDGSVIIHMEDTLFRLHRSALARKSPFFSQLLEDQLDNADAPVLNGCPVAQVDGDASDFAELLTAMDDGL